MRSPTPTPRSGGALRRMISCLFAYSLKIRRIPLLVVVVILLVCMLMPDRSLSFLLKPALHVPPNNNNGVISSRRRHRIPTTCSSLRLQNDDDDKGKQVVAVVPTWKESSTEEQNNQNELSMKQMPKVFDHDDDDDDDVVDNDNDHSDDSNNAGSYFQEMTMMMMSRRSAMILCGLAAIGATTTTANMVQPADATQDVSYAIQGKDASSPVLPLSKTMPVVDTTTSLSISDVATTTTTTTKPSNADWKGIFQKASKKALGGGKAGASAAVVQVFSLMWLRTSMNYQYRYGGNLQSSLQTLWKEGGIPRLYQGLPFALIQGPATRFGDTAANVGILALLESLPQTQSLPLPIKTACGSFAAGAWRIALMPIDASKTAMQVEGSDGLQRLWGSVTERGPGPLYRGAFAQAGATAAGHFPWFLTYNFFNEQLPAISSSDDLFLSLVRAAFLGLAASCVSDCVSNSLRVIKTTKQTAQLGDDVAFDGSQKELSYQEVVSLIIEKDGLAGLFGRGLQTRLLTNAIQGAVFSVLWKYFQQAGSV